MTDAPELKPCPFCGGKAERIEIEDDEPTNSGGSVICCSVCQASSHVEFGRKENLVSLWNRRADLTPTDAQVMANEKVRALVEDQQRLIYVLEGVHAAIRTGRNEPLEIWRGQIEIALEAVQARAALRDLEDGNG